MDTLRFLRAERLQSEGGPGWIWQESLKMLRHRWPLTGRGRALVVIVALVAFAGAILFCRENRTAHLEHGALENLQAAAITAAAILFTLAAFRFAYAERVLSFGLALFCFVFLLLEFDTRAFNIPMLRRLTNGAVRNIWVGTLVALYAVALWRNRRAVIVQFFSWLRGRAGLLMLISGGFWIGAAVFEHGKLLSNTDVTLMLEEVVEVNAALFMAWSAFATVKRSRAAKPV